jgi:hypothetical protein
MVHIQTNFTAAAMNTGKKADATVAPKVVKPAKKEKPVVAEAPVVVEEVVVEAPVVEEPVVAEPDAE